MGAAIQYAQIRLTARFVARMGTKVAALIMAAKALLWVGLIAGLLAVSVQALIAGIAGTALMTIGYAVAHLLSVRRRE